jgi:hypothetical protein
MDEFGAPLAGEISREAGGIGAGLGQDGGHHRRVLDVELALPEALEGDVVVSPQRRFALPLRVQHADRRDLRVPDLLRAADHQAAFPRLTPAIHVAVLDAPPLMRRALLLDHLPAVIDPRRAHEIGEVEIVGQPVETDRKVALELVGEVLRQIGVGAFVIDVDRDIARLGHRRLLVTRRYCHGNRPERIPRFRQEVATTKAGIHPST